MLLAKRALGLVAGGLLLFLAASTAAHAAPSATFKYQHPGGGYGYFQRGRHDSWMELGAFGTVFHFKETQDWEKAVELYDPSRGIGILITDHKVLIRFAVIPFAWELTENAHSNVSAMFLPRPVTHAIAIHF